MNKLLETILAYHDNGLVIVPLRDKIPLLKNWQKTVWQKQLNQGVFNSVKSAGWVIPKSHLVIDIDNHSDEKIGNKSIKNLSEFYNFDLVKNAAVKVITASGGLHLYYKVPEKFQNSIFTNSLPNFPCVEFKHVGRQVVIPNSVLSDGRTYRFHVLTGGDLKKISELPDHFIQALTQAEQRLPIEPKNKPEHLAIDSLVDLERFITMLDGLPVQTEGDRNNLFYRLACEGKDLGLSRQKIFEELKKFNDHKVTPRLNQSEIKACVDSAFKYAKTLTPVKSVALDFSVEDSIKAEKVLTTEEAKKQFSEIIDWRSTFIVDSKGNVSRTKFATKNTEIFLDNLPEFKKKLAVNLFSMDTIWRRPAPWHKPTILTGEIDKILDDDDLIRIREALNREGFDPTSNHILEAARSVSLRNEYHPVKEYLEALPQWDGKERLQYFFPVFCSSEDCAYSRQIGIKLFTAVVARIYNPGCKFDYLPILIGDQGIGKSTLLETLAIKPQWYTDNLGAIDNKDVILRMRSKLIVENAELTMFDKNDPNIVKAFLSRRVDRDRLPYDRLPRDLPRQCVIIATTNKDRFLQDETGNRRMWPIEVFKIDLPKIKAALPQLYAEAIVRFKAGEQLYLDDKAASDIAMQKQEERYNTDDLEPVIEEYLSGKNKITIMLIWEQCFMRAPEMLGYREQKRIGAILRRLGWSRKSVEIDGKIVSGFKK